MCLGCKSRDARISELEASEKNRMLHTRSKLFMDVFPDDELPVRILEAYIDDSYFSDNTGGFEPENWVCVEMNKAQNERNVILRRAIDRLRGMA